MLVRQPELQLIPYVELAGVSFVAGLATLASAWLMNQVLLLGSGLRSRLTQAAIASLGFGIFAVAAFVQIFVPVFMEHLRLFIKSGWLPLLWWGACLVASVAPTTWYITRRFAQERARRLNSRT